MSHWTEDVGEISDDPLEYGKFEWTIPNVIAGESTGMFFASPWFYFQDNDWQILLFKMSLRSQGELDNKGIALLFQKRPLFGNAGPFHVEISMRAIEGVPDTENLLNKNLTVGKLQLMPDFFKTSRFSSQATLSFSCTIRELDSDETEGDSWETEAANYFRSTDSITEKGVDRLQQNFGQLLSDGDHSDVVLRVGGEELPVHKAILSARSPVFAAMFRHSMTETISDIARIPDCTAEAFRVLLRYIYTGRSDTVAEENVFDVHYAADKYQLDYLKEHCIEFMKRTLSVDTFCSVIALSLKHDESDLQKMATSFFCYNFKKIIKTVEWQRYIQENPIHANDLFIKAVRA